MVSVLAKLGGRKFVLAVFGAVAIAAHAWLGIDESAVMTLGAVISAYIFGQGIADGLSGGVTSTRQGFSTEGTEKE